MVCNAYLIRQGLAPSVELLAVDWPTRVRSIALPGTIEIPLTE